MPSSLSRFAPGVLVCFASCGPPQTSDCPSATTPPAGPWANTYGGPSGDKAAAIAATRDGELIVGGSTRSFGAAAEDDWILKLARSGEVRWEIRVEGSGTESADAVAATRDGGAVMVSTRSISAGPSSRRGAILVARFDCAGELVWAKTLAVGEFGDFSFVQALRDTPDGGFLLAGGVNDSPELGADCLVLKLSADGNLEWQRAYGRPDGGESCTGIALAGGGYVLAGEYERIESGRRRNDVWLLGLGARGDVAWEQTYGEPDVEEARSSIREDGHGTFLVTFGRNGEPQLLAVDASGAPVWQKGYRASVGVGVTDLWVAPDGSGTMVGTTGGDEDVWAMHVGPLGDPIWSRRYGPDTLDRGEGVAGFDDGAVVLAGTLAWGSPRDADEVWVAHPGADGRVGSSGSDVPVTAVRMNVATQDTAVRVRVPSVDVESVSPRVTRTAGRVRSLP